MTRTLIPPAESKALSWCLMGHRGQMDADNRPHSAHCIRVAQRFTGDLRIIALLHDLLEDTETEYHEVEKAFGTKIARAVLCLIRGRFEPYEAFIGRVLTNPDSVRVKIADIQDNLQRMVPEKAHNIPRYRDALVRLRAAL